MRAIQSYGATIKIVVDKTKIVDCTSMLKKDLCTELEIHTTTFVDTYISMDLVNSIIELSALYDDISMNRISFYGLSGVQLQFLQFNYINSLGSIVSRKHSIIRFSTFNIFIEQLCIEKCAISAAFFNIIVGVEAELAASRNCKSAVSLTKFTKISFVVAR